MCPSPEPVTGHMCLMSEWSGRQADGQVEGRGGVVGQICGSLSMGPGSPSAPTPALGSD